MSLPCGCHVAGCNTWQWSRATIGGKGFTAGQKFIPDLIGWGEKLIPDFTTGEKLIRGHRCGSVVTSASSGHSMYGLVKQFVRVVCACLRLHDFAVLVWFPRPTYPDGDPLTVRVDLDGIVDVNDMNVLDVISLFDIEPSRVAVDLDPQHNCMFMLRMEGVDTM